MASSLYPLSDTQKSLKSNESNRSRYIMPVPPKHKESEERVDNEKAKLVQFE